MSIAQKIADRLKIADDVQAKTLNESKALLKEAKTRHDEATAQIEILAGKKALTEEEKLKYAELQAARLEAEKAYYMLSNTLKLYGNSDAEKNR